MAKKKFVTKKKDKRLKQKFKIHDDLWYIIYIYRHLYSNTLRTIVVKKLYQTKREARMALGNIKDPKLKHAFEILRGRDVIYYGIKPRRNPISHKLNKYNYPVERDTPQARKSFRTTSRRWLRDFGIVLRPDWVN